MGREVEDRGKGGKARERDLPNCFLRACSRHIVQPHKMWLYCVCPQCLRCLATTSASLRCRRSMTTGTVSPRFVELFHRPTALASKKGKGSPYSNAERRVPELIPVLGSQPAGDPSHTTVGCHCFPPGLQLPSQP